MATTERQQRIDRACLQRDLIAYEAVGVLKAMQAGGTLPAYSSGHEVIARFVAATAEIEVASGVRQEPAEVPA